jgi:sulfite exporter TauE/SafE
MNLIMAIWISAFMLGLAGSLHCLGMCGPIALALPRATEETALGFRTGRLLYNLGRTATYAVLGAAFGWLGRSFHLAGWQQGLSIACGAAMLLYLAGRYLARGRFHVDVLLVRAVAPVQRALARRLGVGSRHSLFGIGLLNGLLPCGLVYVALAGATATGNPRYGALYMALFGLGTTPLMIAVGIAGPGLYARWRGRFHWLIPTGLAVLAVLFILRGLSLGIPYISPRLAADPGSTTTCCSGSSAPTPNPPPNPNPNPPPNPNPE